MIRNVGGIGCGMKRNKMSGLEQSDVPTYYGQLCTAVTVQQNPRLKLVNALFAKFTKATLSNEESGRVRVGV